MPEGNKLHGDTGNKQVSETHIKQEQGDTLKTGRRKQMRDILERLRPFMATDGSGGSGGGDGGDGGNGDNGSGGNGGSGGGKAAEIDYEKLIEIVEGRTAATQDSVLKGYFKDQGLSKEEAEQAMAAFKKQKQESTPDVAQLQQKLTDAEARALKADVKAAAYDLAADLGLTNKEIPYILKLADMKDVAADGKVNTENLKKALEKVLEDMPQLKPKKDEGGGGFRGRVGGDGGGKQPDEKEAAMRKAFGLPEKKGEK